MTTWNYRIVRDLDGNYTVREIYYDDEGNIDGWTIAITPWGETYQEFTDDLDAIIKAKSYPALDEEWLREREPK